MTNPHDVSSHPGRLRTFAVDCDGASLGCARVDAVRTSAGPRTFPTVVLLLFTNRIPTADVRHFGRRPVAAEVDVHENERETSRPWQASLEGPGSVARVGPGPVGCSVRES
jgi:hypothetical protein